MNLPDDVTLSVRHKSVPPRFWGRAAVEVAAERHPLADFSTPLLTFDRAASDHNVSTLMAWAHERGLELAPHGKTTMAPALWNRLLDAGAWGLTVATPWQAQVARAAGVGRLLIANQVVDPVAIEWLASQADSAQADAGAEIACWVDSVEGVRLLAESAGTRPVDVLSSSSAPPAVERVRAAQRPRSRWRAPCWPRRASACAESPATRAATARIAARQPWRASGTISSNCASWPRPCSRGMRSSTRS
jgi:hypothetical protein